MNFGRTLKNKMTVTALCMGAAMALSNTAAVGNTLLEDNTKTITFESSGSKTPGKTMKCGEGVVTLISGSGMFYSPESLSLNARLTRSETVTGAHKVLSVVKYQGETTIYFEKDGKTVEKSCKAIETAKES